MAMILNPPLKTSSFTNKLVALKHRSKRHKRVMVAGLMLTSMVDMFSLLVIFLLQSFSNSPEVMALSKGLTLPAAISAAPAIDAPLLTITNEQVLLDQKAIGSASAILSRPDVLLTGLAVMKTHWLSSHHGEDFKGDIHLQADRGLPSSLVSRFIGLLNSQGYASVHLAVVNGGSK